MVGGRKGVRRRGGSRGGMVVVLEGLGFFSFCCEELGSEGGSRYLRGVCLRRGDIRNTNDGTPPAGCGTIGDFVGAGAVEFGPPNVFSEVRVWWGRVAG